MNDFYRILIVVGAIVLFVGSYLLNKKTPVPNNIKESDLPEKCLNCASTSCGVKKEEIVDDTIVEELIKNCEEKDHEYKK